MRNRSSSASRKHQLVLSLSPRCLHALHFERGLLGWKLAHEELISLPDGEGFQAQLLEQLSQCVLLWKVPRNARAHWVLAGDILGIIPPTSNTPQTNSAALPFSAGETRTQPDQFSKSANPSLMWIHKDWVTEIERISNLCHLELVEIFARAQLFQHLAAKLQGLLKIVLEQQHGQTFLHMYATDGMMLRTRVLESEESSVLRPLIASELAALAVPTTAKNTMLPLLASAPLIAKPVEWEGFTLHALAKRPSAQSVEQLWHSDQEGIVIRATHADLVQTIKLSSMAMGIAGLLCLGLMAWHDGKLQEQIEIATAQARKDRPKVVTAKALKSRTLHMANAVKAAQSLHARDGAITGWTMVLSHFPAPPATLLYVRTDEDSLAFAGTGNDASVNWLREKDFIGYEPLRDLPVPAVLEGSNVTIHLQTRKLHPEALPASAQIFSTASKAP